MDSPNLISMPIDIALLIADQLPRCRDVLNLMRVYLSANHSPDATQHFQAIMYAMDAKKMHMDLFHHSYNRPAIYWAIEKGNRDVVRSVLAAYTKFHSIRRLYCIVYQRTAERPTLSDSDSSSEADLTMPVIPEWTPAWLIDPELQFPLALSRVLVPQGISQGTSTETSNRISIKNPTPPMLAVQSGRIDLLELVVEYANCPEMLDAERTMTIPTTPPLYGLVVTALTLSAYYGRLDMVQLLVAAGSKIHWAPLKCNDPAILASLSDWGVGLDTSEAQEVGRLAVLEYLLDKGQQVNSVDLNSFRYLSKFWNFSTPPHRQFTPLLYSLWDIRPRNVQRAQLLIRRGARWAPWTAWASAPWEKRRCRVFSSAWDSAGLSPLEWVVVGNPRVKDGREAEQQEAENALFKTMMEEGVEQPATPEQLQWALEVVIQGGGCRSGPRRRQLHFNWVRYMLGKGALVDKLSYEFAVLLRDLLHGGGWKISDLVPACTSQQTTTGDAGTAEDWLSHRIAQLESQLPPRKGH